MDYHKKMPYLCEHFFGVYPSDILFAHSSEPVCLKAKDEMIHCTLYYIQRLYYIILLLYYIQRLFRLCSRTTGLIFVSAQKSIQYNVPKNGTLTHVKEMPIWYGF